MRIESDRQTARLPGHAAFTLIELMVALSIGASLMYVGWQAITLLARGEKGVDRESGRAITEARLMEYLTRDIRSSVGVAEIGAGHYRITRYFPVGGRLQRQDVEWIVQDGRRVTRRQEGQPEQEFNFNGLLEVNSPALSLRLERSTDAVFTQ